MLSPLPLDMLCLAVALGWLPSSHFQPEDEANTDDNRAETRTKIRVLQGFVEPLKQPDLRLDLLLDAFIYKIVNGLINCQSPTFCFLQQLKAS